MKLKRTIAIAGLSLFLTACGSSSSGSSNNSPVTPNKPPVASDNQYSAQTVFDEFWNIFDKYYPLMARKNINWQQVYDNESLKLNATTTREQLAQVIGNIVANTIKDGHTHAQYKQREFAFEPEQTSEQQRLDQMLANTDALINFDQASVNNNYISFGTLKSDSSIGYIKSKVFEPSRDSDAEFNNFKQVVDRALQTLVNSKGIIVDIRTNGGGQGHFAYYLAGRFATDAPKDVVRMRYKASTGSTESALSGWVGTQIGNFDGYNDNRAFESEGNVAATYDELNRFNASGDFQYAKKVALLTAKGSASAAEFFTVAMKSQNQVRSFGDTTFGIFAGSDFLRFNSDKDWIVRVSTQDVEVNYAGKFQSFEGTGIKPDEVLYPTAQQITAGEDIHIQAAVNYINND